MLLLPEWQLEDPEDPDMQLRAGARPLVVGQMELPRRCFIKNMAGCLAQFPEQEGTQSTSKSL